MMVVRPVKRVLVWSRTTEHARALAHEASARFGVSAAVSPTPAHAMEHASIVCATSASPTPIVEGDRLRPGTHVNAVGACLPTTRELDTRAVVRARLYVDRRESALAEPGDIITPLQDGAITRDHIVAEIGELLLPGRKRLGRSSDTEITLFKSLGLAIEDLAAAHHVYRKAMERGVGQWLELGGRHASDEGTTPA